ncbi:hypothetical protein BDR22DRAFT_385213 [Usnea florida]
MRLHQSIAPPSHNLFPFSWTASATHTLFKNIENSTFLDRPPHIPTVSNKIPIKYIYQITIYRLFSTQNHPSSHPSNQPDTPTSDNAYPHPHPHPHPPPPPPNHRPHNRDPPLPPTTQSPILNLPTNEPHPQRRHGPDERGVRHGMREFVRQGR